MMLKQYLDCKLPAVKVFFYPHLCLAWKKSKLANTLQVFIQRIVKERDLFKCLWVILRKRALFVYQCVPQELIKFFQFFFCVVKQSALHIFLQLKIASIPPQFPKCFCNPQNLQCRGCYSLVFILWKSFLWC
jgi:hypothetical protein